MLNDISILVILLISNEFFGFYACFKFWAQAVKNPNLAFT